MSLGRKGLTHETQYSTMYVVNGYFADMGVNFDSKSDALPSQDALYRMKNYYDNHVGFWYRPKNLCGDPWLCVCRLHRVKLGGAYWCTKYKLIVWAPVVIGNMSLTPEGIKLVCSKAQIASCISKWIPICLAEKGVEQSSRRQTHLPEINRYGWLKSSSCFSL